MVWLKWGAILIAGLVGFWLALSAYGHNRWQSRTAALAAELVAARQAIPVSGDDPGSIQMLPPPVQRYLAAALTPGQRQISGVTLSQTGTFNMGEVEDNWKPFTAKQEIETARPGFLWDAKIDMAPGLPVRVHDAYVAGEGVLVPAVLGIFPLAEMRGGGAIAAGELMRFLAEAPWYPTVLLPGRGVRWVAIDDRSARAFLTDGAVTVSLVFTFGTDDLVASVRADTRDRTVGGILVPTPWEGTWSDYRPWAGMMIPMAGEVAWILTSGPKPYWRGRVTGLTYRNDG